MGNETQINRSLSGGETMINDSLRQTQLNPALSVASDALPEGTLLLGKYRVLQGMDVSSGEAALYHCSYQSSEYVAKVYRREIAIKQDVIEALQRVSSPFIARLYDSGVHEGMPVEILPYYKNGSIQGKRFSFETLKKVIIPCLNEGLHALHEIGVIHKDLKPSNIMLRDDGETVAIIDFGISSVFQDGRTVLVTQTGMTPEYSAPETFRNVYLEESDYYALGISIYELFCGHTPYHNMSPDEITRYMSVQRLPFPESVPTELRELILGLTYNDLTNRNDPENPNRRWTYEEVKKWTEGIEQIVPGEATGNAATNRIPAYRFNGKGYTDLRSLAEALAADWENGKKQLYRGLLSGFFMATDPELAGLCMDMEEAMNEDPSREDVLFWQLIYTIAPDIRKIYWNGKQYSDLTALGEKLRAALEAGTFSDDQMLKTILTESLISSYMQTHGYREDQVLAFQDLESAYRRQSKNRREREITCWVMAYLLSGNKLLRVNGEEFQSVEALAEHLNRLMAESFDDADAFCAELMPRGEILASFEAWLIALGKKDELNRWKSGAVS